MKKQVYSPDTLNFDSLVLISIGSLVGFGLGNIFANYYYPASLFMRVLAPLFIVMGLAKAYELRNYLFNK